MAIFLAPQQTSTAARCGLKIHYAVNEIVNPKLKAQYPTTEFQVRQVVGIDKSEIRAARTGVRGDDIVWVGRAANYAAKLTELDHPPRTRLTEAAYGYCWTGLRKAERRRRTCGGDIPGLSMETERSMDRLSSGAFNVASHASHVPTAHAQSGSAPA